MTARTGMSDLITNLRGMCDAGTADYTVGIVSYWSDDQLQKLLDHHRTDYTFVGMSAISSKDTSGAVVYKEYRVPFHYLEGGTMLSIQDASGAAIGTATYTPDYDNGIFSFAVDTGGSALYINARSFDLYGAAVDVWNYKAAHAAIMYDFSTDNHKLSRSQYMAHCKEMVSLYQSMAGPQTANLLRGDLYGC